MSYNKNINRTEIALNLNGSEIKERLRAYICNEILKNKDYSLKDDESLITGGLIDSFSLVHVAVFIEREIGVKIPDTDLTVETMDTINLMTAQILLESQRKK
jgi:acyl carrier protein